MAELQRFPVVTTAGETGHVLRRARFIDPSEQSRVILEDGTELTAPASDLEAQNDGSFLLRRSQDPPVQNVPESTHPTSQPPAPAAISAETLFADEVGIDRVAVNQIVDELPTNRQEGDILIIPVVEEILVVQKRYMIKEEIRINRSRRPVSEPRRILVNGQETRS
ncbi:MAG: DUF2382 domain-containing protein [Bryobacteraceae bacterium]|nr:DUF2382 domain-containing protein [Bryobacteraceae bacterium]